MATVSGELTGELPSTVSALARGELQVLTTALDVQSDGTLYTPFPKENIASVDLTDASLNIRKTFDIDIANNQIAGASLVTITLPVGESYLPFTDERYTLIRSDGLIEVLTADKFAFSADGRELQIRNLGANDTGAKLTVTVQKRKVKSKKKIRTSLKINIKTNSFKTLSMLLLKLL